MVPVSYVLYQPKISLFFICTVHRNIFSYSDEKYEYFFPVMPCEIPIILLELLLKLKSHFMETFGNYNLLTLPYLYLSTQTYMTWIVYFHRRSAQQYNWAKQSEIATSVDENASGQLILLRSTYIITETLLKELMEFAVIKFKLLYSQTNIELSKLCKFDRPIQNDRKPCSYSK